jgi:hypothetical protein
MQDNVWTIEVAFTEDGDRTRADAIVMVGERRYHGWGRARRSPGDPDVPRIGHELSAARALSDLAHQLLDAAADDVAAYEGHPVTLRE